MTVEVTGLDTVLARLERLGIRVSRADVWRGVLGGTVRSLQRFAVDISPVVTGSYQSSHQTVVRGMTATLSIDPTARNVVTGDLVTSYAGSVEERHQVYKRTVEEIPRAVGESLRDLLQEVVA